MYQNIESLHHVTGTNTIVGPLYFKTNSYKKRSDLWLPEVRRGGGDGQLAESSQKVQTSNYNISKY